MKLKTQGRWLRSSRFTVQRWFGLVLGAMLLVILSAPAVVAAGARHYDELEFPPLREVQLPDYERYQLENGLVVYLVENHELPLVRGNAFFRTGARLEPSDQVGLAELTGTVIRTGGTTNHPSNELNELLEQRAASVETSIGGSLGSASFNALSEDLKTVFDWFADVVQRPAFEEARLALAQNQMRGGIARRNDDPNSIASREFFKLVYGESSPYARTVEYTTLSNITREDVVRFYQQSFRPERMMLGIVGDFNREEMKALIAEKFGSWQGVQVADLPEIPEVRDRNPQGLFFVEQPQLTQSYIQLGHLGGRVDDPDYPALSVLNGVLNGFGGRLFNEVRSRQGLAYSVYGFWSPNFDYPGVFIAGGQTRSEATVPFIQSILGEVNNLRSTPISSEELDYAKNSILNSFVFNFQSPGQTLSRLMRYEYYDYPADYIFQYQRQVQATTIEDVQRVAQTYLTPDQLTTLVVGNSSEITPPLSRLDSNITTVDITIPNPQS
ncbi:insulinase family protein [Spirulina subsalsa FACHB-351]|uniref:Insulinase family protein n=1 Tax=Spirulina subsalsa FACHB-351 TaxID=234711 RepID=A0ABT3L8H1_9CYAN|nr:pitrilysin family protein [Spirulina subsalsa]MCW6037789.1 insulinase family protein [Spirulina subsalsa FACHB-351]